MPATIEQLPASPQAILEHRSLYVPLEPTFPESTLSVWDNLFTNQNSLSFEMKDSLGYLWRDVQGGYNRKASLNIEVLEDAVSVESLEWYIHQKADELRQRYAFGMGYGHNTPTDSAITAATYFSARRKENSTSLMPSTMSGVFVIPEPLDGQLSNIFCTVGTEAVGPYRGPVDLTVIGNVNRAFAEGMHQGDKVTLYGNAGSGAFRQAGGPVLSRTQKAPRAQVYGNVGEDAASHARSLVLSVFGSADEDLAYRAGYERDFHETDEHDTRVVIRIEGNAGRNVANHGYGRLHISCGSLGGVGDVSAMKGDIHVGPYPPSHPKFISNPGKILYRNGQRWA